MALVNSSKVRDVLIHDKSGPGGRPIAAGDRRESASLVIRSSTSLKGGLNVTSGIEYKSTSRIGKSRRGSSIETGKSGIDFSDFQRN
jgi:hypothetical protein